MHYTPQLIGNQHIQSYLQKTIKNGTVASAQLWSGPDHIGKTTFLINYLFSLSCQQLSEEHAPCLKCGNCLALQRNNCPNVIWLDAMDKAVKFDAILRARADSLHSTLYAGVRALIISHAEQLHVTSSNALLKLLEEPTAGVQIFLLSAAADQIVPTILSRCLALNFTLVSAEAMAKGLATASHQTIALAQGLPGQAKLFQATPRLEADWLNAITCWIQIMKTTSYSERLQLAQPWLNQERSQQSSLGQVLCSLSLVLRDVLYIQTDRASDIVATTSSQALHTIAQQHSLTNIISALTKTLTLWQRQSRLPIQKKLALINLLLVI